jgi:uncharacterized protein
MKASPFIYGQTVSSNAFTNREHELEKLQSNLLQGINTMLISPRRWGKSSLVEKAVNNIRKKHPNHKTIVIDLFSVGTEKEFLEIFTREVLKAASDKWEERLRLAKDIFKMLVPSINLGTDPYSEVSISFDIKELKKYSDEILELPEKLAIKKKIKLVICLDEFQNLATFAGYRELEKKMRAVWQRQKSVTYCLYGSKRHMMTEIFNNPSKPFYRFGDIMLLKKIAEKKWTDFLISAFNRSGKTIGKDAAVKIPQLMKCHSWYVQQLAHYTWNLTSRKANLNEVEKALSEVIMANSPLFQKEVESLSGTQVNLLKAMVKGESKFTSVEVMHKFHLGTPNNVSKNKKMLIENDLIAEEENIYDFVDPVFGLWFRKQYFNIAFGEVKVILG